MTRPVLIPALFILALVGGCATTGTAEGQRPEEAEAAGENGKSVAGEGLVAGEEEAGGFSRIDTGHRRAVQAYAVLERELASLHPEIELGAVRDAFMQVVDGFNVRLVCAYSRTGSRTGDGGQGDGDPGGEPEGGGPDSERTLEAMVYLSARSDAAGRLVSLDLGTGP